VGDSDLGGEPGVVRDQLLVHRHAPPVAQILDLGEHRGGYRLTGDAPRADGLHGPADQLVQIQPIGRWPTENQAAGRLHRPVRIGNLRGLGAVIDDGRDRRPAGSRVEERQSFRAPAKDGDRQRLEQLGRRRHIEY
jgi:hypothetical protein